MAENKTKPTKSLSDGDRAVLKKIISKAVKERNTSGLKKDETAARAGKWGPKSLRLEKGPLSHRRKKMRIIPKARRRRDRRWMGPLRRPAADRWRIGRDGGCCRSTSARACPHGGLQPSSSVRQGS